MAVSYNRLWKLLIDKNMIVAERRRAAEIEPNTVTSMQNHQAMTIAGHEKLGTVLEAESSGAV